jgi:hypothetical protein
VHEEQPLRALRHGAQCRVGLRRGHAPPAARVVQDHRSYMAVGIMQGSITRPKSSAAYHAYSLLWYDDVDEQGAVEIRALRRTSPLDMIQTLS